MRARGNFSAAAIFGVIICSLFALSACRRVVTEPENEIGDNVSSEIIQDIPEVSVATITVKCTCGEFNVENYDTIENLDLSSYAVLDLSPLYSCTSLTGLNLSGSSISIEDYDSLQAALPGCTIHWDVPFGERRISSDAESISLLATDSGELWKLIYFPRLVDVDASACTDYALLRTAVTNFTAISFDYCISLCGTEYSCKTESIDLSCIDASGYGEIENIVYFPYLKYADLRCCTLIPEQMKLISDFLPDTQLLFSFTVAGINTDSCVTELDLSGIEIGDISLISSYMPYMPSLEILEACDCGIPDEDMAALREEYPDVEIVWTVHMRKWSLRTDAVAFSTKNSSDSSVMLKTEDIEPLKYCTELVALDLGHNRIDDLTVIGTLTNLKALMLVDNEFSDLSPLRNLTKLEFLELYENHNITDVSPLADMPSLREVNLSRCPSIHDFTSLTASSSIEKLWLNGKKMDMDACGEIAGLMPETCTVYYYSDYSNGGGWRSSGRYKGAYEMFDTNEVAEIYAQQNN